MNYDVSGPDGNVNVVMARAHRWARECWGDHWEEKWTQIETDAKSRDYDHALDVIEKAFNGSIKFIGRETEETDS